jgi:hypothetical protein
LAARSALLKASYVAFDGLLALTGRIDHSGAFMRYRGRQERTSEYGGVTKRAAGPRTSLFIACLTAGAALTDPSTAQCAATTWLVNTCIDADSGTGTTGSLRYAARKAASGDIVDMSGLQCGKITLTTGAVTIDQNDLTLLGPGANSLAITGLNDGVTELDRILNHQGSGTLTVKNLSTQHGDLRATTGTGGGCIYSFGNIYLSGVDVISCSAISFSGRALGGGVYSAGSLTLKQSVLRSNQVIGGPGAGNFGWGGGAFAAGDFIANYSTIANNNSTDSNTSKSFAGGVAVRGDAFIRSSTISGNSASFQAGGLQLHPSTLGGGTATIVNSTISHNYSHGTVGGIYSAVGTLIVRNSTIAFNSAAVGQFGYYDVVTHSTSFASASPGLMLFQKFYATMNVTLESSLLSANTYDEQHSVGLGSTDLSHPSDPFFGGGSYTISGSHNFVGITPTNVPADTIKNQCAFLGPLRDNGGPTQTHALRHLSPAIDKGINPLHLMKDQRGVPGANPADPYARVSGIAADIGAYEVDQADMLFSDDFDGCNGAAI